ncbi:uncharacterized protein LOC119993242 isoform X1 [Tripterygium wilfordii]|uniref:uncharacterized protein LOC119993242 isoform X1 n=1 Tax=Tripterygium wilfordii TaxID=458696 RepID=UPI0018F84AB1|nr:uncharacterized protein LOC119993242 isoform X1 [Tripterygium wilfordii]
MPRSPRKKKHNPIIHPTILKTETALRFLFLTAMAESSPFTFANTHSPTPASGTQFSLGSVREDYSDRCHHRRVVCVRRNAHRSSSAVKSVDFVISQDNVANKFEDQKNSLAADGWCSSHRVSALILETQVRMNPI